MNVVIMSQCTYRCVVLPDEPFSDDIGEKIPLSQCTYRCVVLPDIDLGDHYGC